MAFRQGKTLSELLASLSGARELGELMAFYDLEPPGEVDRQMFGNIMAAIFNASGNFKRARKPSEFIPKYERKFITVADKRKAMREKIFAVFGKPKS